jgi:hypothetical protein
VYFHGFRVRESFDSGKSRDPFLTLAPPLIGALEFGRLSRSMAEMKDLDQTLLLMDLVVDEDRSVDQLTHPRPLSTRASHAGEKSEQIDMIEQGLAKTGSSLVVVLGDMPHDLGQIA